MQKPATVEIQWGGEDGEPCVWRGAVVGGLGVLTRDDGSTYAGGVAGGTFDGRGVFKWVARSVASVARDGGSAPGGARECSI